MEEKKKKYEKPTAQMIRFMYRDQVVAASGKCSVGVHGDQWVTAVCQEYRTNVV